MQDRPWIDTEANPQLPSFAPEPLRSLFGYGPDHFLFAYPLSDTEQLEGARHYHAHNFIVNSAVELGAVGFGVTLLLMAAAVGASLRYLVAARRGAYPLAMSLVLVGIVGALAGRFVEQLTGVPQISDLLLFWLLLGLLAVFARAATPGADHDRPTQASAKAPSLAPRRWALAAAGLVTVALMGFAWQTNAKYVYASAVAASAGTAFERSEYRVSLERLDRAIGLAPDVTAYRLNKATLLTLIREEATTPEDEIRLLTLAQDEVGEAIDRAPLAHRPWAKAGELGRELALLDERYADDSLRAHETLVALLPGYWAAYNVLAQGYLEFGRPEDAIRPLAASIQITGDSPRSAQALHQLGEALAATGRDREAVIVLGESLLAKPNHASAREAHKLLAELYAELGDNERATDHLAVHYFIKGAQLKAEGANIDALVALRTSLEIDPAHLFAPQAERLAGEIARDLDADIKIEYVE